MSIIKRIVLLFFATAFIVGFVACEKGPMEKAGKKADKAVEDVQKAVKKKTEQLGAILIQLLKTLYSYLFILYSLSLYPAVLL